MRVQVQLWLASSLVIWKVLQPACCCGYISWIPLWFPSITMLVAVLKEDVLDFGFKLNRRPVLRTYFYVIWWQIHASVQYPRHLINQFKMKAVIVYVFLHFHLICFYPGFWMGLAIGITPVAVFYIIIMLYTDWGTQVEKVRQAHQLKPKSFIM